MYIFLLIVGGSIILIYLAYFVAVLFQSDYARAMQYEKEGLIDNAISAYLDHITKYPDHLLSHYRLGKLYLTKSLFEKVMEEFETVLKLAESKRIIFPEELEIYKVLVKIYADNSRLTEAFLTHRKILEISLNSLESLKYVAFCYIGADQYDTAREYFEKYLELVPDNADMRFYYGLLLYQLGSPDDEVIEEMKKVLQADSHYFNAYEVLGYLYLKTDLKQALKNFQIARGLTKIFKKKITYDIMVAMCHALLGQMEKAGAIARELLKYADGLDVKTRTTIYYLTVYTHFFLKRQEEFTEYLHLLIKNDFSFIDIYEVYQTESDTKTGKEKIKEHFKNFVMNQKFQSISERFLSYRGINMKVTESVFLRWKNTRSMIIGEKRSTGEEKSVVRNAVEFSQLTLSSFKKVSEKLVKRLGFIIDNTLPTKKGFDCIGRMGELDIPQLILVRNWTGVIGEIQISEVYEEMEKLSFKAGVLITCGEYTAAAQTLANSYNIKLINIDVIDRILSSGISVT